MLRSFFAEFLWLVVPNLAGHLDLRHPVFLDKEFFTVEGQRRELDLLARMSFLSENREPLLIHVEVETRATSGMGRRLWRYRNQIQAVHDSQVLSIVLYLHRGGASVQSPALFETALVPALESFRYISFGLAGCDAAEYLSRPEPLAWGLAALMRPVSFTRPQLKLSCLRRIATAELDETRSARGTERRTTRGPAGRTPGPEEDPPRPPRAAFRSAFGSDPRTGRGHLLPGPAHPLERKGADRSVSGFPAAPLGAGYAIRASLLHYKSRFK